MSIEARSSGCAYCTQVSPASVTSAAGRHATVAGGRVPDDEPLRPELRERGVEHCVLQHRLAVDRAAVPERAVDAEFRRLLEGDELGDQGLHPGRSRVAHGERNVSVAAHVPLRQHAGVDQLPAQTEVPDEVLARAVVQREARLAHDARGAAVDVGGIVDHDDRWQRQQPLSVSAVGGKCRLAGQEAARVALVEGRAERAVVHWFGRHLSRAAAARLELGEGLLAHRIGLVGGEGRIVLWHEVAQVADEVHGLVVAEDDVQAAAGVARLDLQPHEQVHDLA
jgi:hypothetical protein